jgi:hypothetical protein
MYFIAINADGQGSMEDPVEAYVVEHELNGDDDLWDENEWGFLDELGYKILYKEIFKFCDEDGIQTTIKSSEPHFKKFVDLSIEYGDVFFEHDFKVISEKRWIELVNNSAECSISICECSPG